MLAESCAIGAADVLHPCRLQIICGSAMEKQDRPKEVRLPCAKLQVATLINSIGSQVAVCANVQDKHSRVARIEQDEKERNDLPSRGGSTVSSSDWSGGRHTSVPDMHTHAGCCPINPHCSLSVEA